MPEDNEEFDLLDIDPPAGDDAAVEKTVEEQLAEEKSRNAKLFERAKKAEGFQKQEDGTWVKKSDPVRPETHINAPSVDPDELKLIARGLSDEEIEQAKVIAKGKDISLNEALKDPMFVSYQKDFKENERREAAKLGASRGSGSDEEESPIKSGMTKEEHQEAWKKTKGK